MTADSEGSWARQYRQGRVEQVRQQEISNLIGVTSVPFLTIDQRRRAAERAYAMLAGKAAPALAEGDS